MFTVKCHETSIYIFAKRLSIISTWVGRVCISIRPTCLGLWATLEMDAATAALPRMDSGQVIELGLKVWESVFCKFKRLYNREKEVIENNCM